MRLLYLGWEEVEANSSPKRSDITETSNVESSTSARSSMFETKSRKLFAGNRIVSHLLLGVAVINTFGLACPLLLACVAGETFSLVLAWRLRLREYVQRKAHVGKVDVACRCLESATSSFGVELNTPVFMAMVIVGLFWSGFFIDISGIKYGILIGGPLPLFLTCCFHSCIGASHMERRLIKFRGN